MHQWISPPVILNGELVSLWPLEEKHFPALEKLATEERIWEYYSFDGSKPGKIRAVLKDALQENEKGTQYPFVIYHKKDDKIIGSTRLMDIHPEHKKLEIGGTWLHPDYWKSAINPECKLLLLSYCFEQLKAVRVQLKTAQENIRSQKAIAKIGGVKEGVFRNDMLRENNTRRISVYYSIIEEDWMQTKIKLQELIQNKKLK